jgi:chromosome segregation ATPase
MIPNLPRALTWRGALAMLGLAALLSRATAEEPPAPEKKVIEYRAIDNKPGEPASPEGAQAQADLKALEAQLAQKQAELKALEAQLHAARDRARKSAEEKARKAAEAELKALAEKLKQQEPLQFRTSPDRPGVVVLGRDTAEAKPGPTKGTLYELVPGEKGTLILRPVAPPQPAQVRTRPPEAGWQIVPNPPVPPGGARAQELEKRLDAIMKELEQLRKEIRAPQSRPSPALPGQPAKPEEHARNVLELRLQVEEAQGQLLELEKAGKQAQAEAEEARLYLEKVRSVAVEGAPQLKAAEERLNALRAHLAKINRARLELTEQADAAKKNADEAARAREAVLRQAIEELKRAKEATTPNP